MNFVIPFLTLWILSSTGMATITSVHISSLDKNRLRAAIYNPQAVERIGEFVKIFEFFLDAGPKVAEEGLKEMGEIIAKIPSYKEQTRALLHLDLGLRKALAKFGESSADPEGSWLYKMVLDALAVVGGEADLS